MEITTNLPIGYSFLCILLSLAVVVFLYRKAQRFSELTFFQRLVPAILRGLVVGGLSFFLLQPMVKYLHIRTEKPIIILAFDQSKSMQQDSMRLMNWLGEMEEYSDVDDYDFHVYGFDDQVKQANVDQPKLVGSKTSYSNLMEFLSVNYEHRNVAGVVLASDGLYNQGLNPVYSNFLKQTRFYTVAFGDSAIRPDIAIQDVRYNQVVNTQTTVPVVFNINSLGMKGEQATIRLRLDGTDIDKKTILISEQEHFQNFRFQIDLEEPGLRQIEIEVFSAKEEQNIENNKVRLFIEVLDKSKSVLLLAHQPHPDLMAIKQALTDQKGVQVDVKFANSGKPDIEPYHLIILHQLPNKKANYPWLADLVKNGPGIWFILGAQSDMAGLKQVQQWVDVRGNDIRSEEVFAVIQKNYGSFLLEGDLENSLTERPFVKPDSEIIAPANSDILAFQRIGALNTPYAFWFTITEADRNIGFLLGEGLWLNRLAVMQQQGSTKSFDGLLQKMTQFLSLSDQKDQLRVVASRRYEADQAVKMTATYYNASYEADNSKSLTLQLKDPSGALFDYYMVPKDEAYEMLWEEMEPGIYTYNVSVSGQPGISKEGAFVVEFLDLEAKNTRADHHLLRQIAIISGGKYYQPDQRDALKEDLLQTKQLHAVQYEEMLFKDLIGIKWICFIFIGLLTLEWVWRKWNGMI